MNKVSNNPWAYEDELEHFPNVREWWCGEAFFRSDDDNRWSLKTGISYWVLKSKRITPVFDITLFDQENNRYYKYCSWKDKILFESTKDYLNVKYGQSYIKGLFPNYELYLKDLDNDIDLDLKLHAKSMPHWVAQDISDGWLPLGLNFYRYGFIPRCNLNGTIKIKNIKHNVNGIGYFEHAYGDYSDRKSLSNFSNIKKIILTYSKLINWWLRNQRKKIPRSLKFGTENNILGYDWVWAVLDNGWSLFFGNILFWLMQGPCTGSLILTKDGITYSESCDVCFKYNKLRYAKELDFYYPTELQIIARFGKEEIHLKFIMDDNIREQVTRLYGKKYWVGIVICEAPGVVEGFSFDGDKKIKLNGICKIEPQRQISVLGHNSLKIDLVLPPNGLGMSFNFESHFLRKKLFTNIQIAPRANIQFHLNKIDISKINR
jgi:hypothetical protein